MDYILALDQGTTSSRAILYDTNGTVVHVAQREFAQIYPASGWVEHDPHEIYNSQLAVAEEVISKLSSTDKVLSIGITNQRETTIVWEKKSGEPIYNAIVWQDRRTAKYCDGLKAEGKEDLINNRTGLLLDPYFSATKINWILENVKGARERANNNELAFGTVDTWLIWRLTDGQVHATDVSNASRTMLFNIYNLNWDNELLDLFAVPVALLPKVLESSDDYGIAKIGDHSIPINGVAGDQQAALFGQMCIFPKMAKCTYGTGCFLVMNTGDTPVKSENKLLTTIGWKINGKITYALEGSIFVGGAVIQWLRDGLNLIATAEESETLAATVTDSGGVVFVPALTGLGAPHWDSSARGSIFGISRGTSSAHIARAALDSIALQVNELLETMGADAGEPVEELRVDGGATANNLLLQLQADMANIPVIRPENLETTALGAAYLAGLHIGLWHIEDLQKLWKKDRIFSSQISSTEREATVASWNKAVTRSKGWL